MTSVRDAPLFIKTSNRRAHEMRSGLSKPENALRPIRNASLFVQVRNPAFPPRAISFAEGPL
jgi:hypothetical protein